MAAGRKKKNDGNLVLAMACGASPEAAAQNSGLSRRTVYRRLEDPAFRAQISSLRAEMARRVAGVLTADGIGAAKALATLRESAASESVRLGAARATLEMGAKLREHVEWDERITAMEARVEMLLASLNLQQPDVADEYVSILAAAIKTAKWGRGDLTRTV